MFNCFDFRVKGLTLSILRLTNIYKNDHIIDHLFHKSKKGKGVGVFSIEEHCSRVASFVLACNLLEVERAC